MVDNRPAIALAKNPVLHDCSKHIDTRFHFIRDCVDGGQIVLEFVESGRQLTDILNKPTRPSSVHGVEDQDWNGGNQAKAARLGEELLNNLLLVLHRSLQPQTNFLASAVQFPCNCRATSYQVPRTVE